MQEEGVRSKTVKKYKATISFIQPPSPSLIHHSDRGSQYASNEYQQQSRDNKIITSMSRKGNCYDNAYIESFHSVIKKGAYFSREI